MRNRLFLLTAAVLLSACADDQHTTAPATSRAARSGVLGDVGPSARGLANAQAKPVDQVGFTKVTYVSSAIIQLPAGQSTQTTATCPDGSTAIGGGYNVTGYLAGATPPFVRFAGLDGQNGWMVRFSNEPAGAASFTYLVTVYCAS